jgi:mRNA interferase MazF
MFKNFLVADIPYLEGSGSKIRPVIQLTDILDEHGNFQVAYITSKIPASPYPTDILIDITHTDFNQTGLTVKSMVRTSKIYTVNQSHVQGLLGILPQDLSLLLDKALKYQFKI